MLNIGRITGESHVAFEQNIVSFRNAGLRYADGADVLRDISFTLAPGSLTFITGASGAGKSTLLRLCHGREKPSRGEVFLFGCNIQTATQDMLRAIRRRIGLVPEGCRLMDHLSAFDNVALPLRLAGHKRADYEKDVQELVTWVGLGDKLGDRPGALSAGECQLIAIARAVVGKPDLLLADEPTANLDEDGAERVIRLLLNIHRFGTTVVIATNHRGIAPVGEGSELRVSGGTLARTEMAA
jgi:cell division transport system ATP-binding protein